MTETYDPNWNPNDYDMTLKYEPMDQSKISYILEVYKNEQVLEYIKQLWKLIDYQKQEILKQRKEIIAIKHKVAWKHYDKEVDYADPKNRVNSNKPKRTDTMGC